MTFRHSELFLYARFGADRVYWSLSVTRKTLHVFSDAYAAGVEIWLDAKQVRQVQACDRTVVQLDLYSQGLGGTLRVYLRGRRLGPFAVVRHAPRTSGDHSPGAM